MREEGGLHARARTLFEGRSLDRFVPAFVFLSIWKADGMRQRWSVLEIGETLSRSRKIRKGREVKAKRATILLGWKDCAKAKAAT